VPPETDKSFLVLFFKKEHLSFLGLCGFSTGSATWAFTYFSTE